MWYNKEKKDERLYHNGLPATPIPLLRKENQFLSASGISTFTFPHRIIYSEADPTARRARRPDLIRRQPRYTHPRRRCRAYLLHQPQGISDQRQKACGVSEQRIPSVVPYVKGEDPMKQNYQQMLDALIDTECSEGRRPSLLLHACCAPCSSYVLEYLTSRFQITVFFYNPNISPKEEYEFREAELKRLITEMGLTEQVRILYSN